MLRRKRDDSLFLLWKRTIAAQIHFLGCLLVLFGAWFLLPAANHAGQAHYWACVSFLTSGFLVFFASALVHFLGDGFDLSPRFHQFLENLDHVGIYLFIAGTYTPFVLSVTAPEWKIPLLATVWAIAGVGIVFTWVKARLPLMLQGRTFRTAVFLTMGWLMVIRINEVFSELSWIRLFLLVAGGLAYTIGAVVYVTRRPRLKEGFFGYHELWHSLVIVGAFFHYCLILSLYYPQA